MLCFVFSLLYFAGITAYFNSLEDAQIHADTFTILMKDNFLNDYSKDHPMVSMFEPDFLYHFGPGFSQVGIDEQISFWKAIGFDKFCKKSLTKLRFYVSSWSSHSYSFDLTKEFKFDDGKTIDVFGTGVMVVNKEGKITAILGEIRDMTQFMVEYSAYLNTEMPPSPEVYFKSESEANEWLSKYVESGMDSMNNQGSKAVNMLKSFYNNEFLSFHGLRKTTNLSDIMSGFDIFQSICEEYNNKCTIKGDLLGWNGNMVRAGIDMNFAGVIYVSDNYFWVDNSGKITHDVTFTHQNTDIEMGKKMEEFMAKKEV